MTQQRTTIVLGVIAAALLAVILIFDRGTLSTGQLEERAGRVLRSFARDSVTRVELVRGDEAPIVFEREPPEEDEEEDEGLALERWRIVAPVRVAADQDAVDGLMSALDWLVIDRVLEDVGAAQRRTFGLDDPRFVIRYRVEAQEVVLRVGGEAPREAGIYVMVEGEDRAYIVGADLIESIDHDLSHFRERSLFPSDFYASSSREIRIEGAGDPILLEKEEDGWHVVRPVQGWASASMVDAIIRFGREARIARFVREGGDDLGEYGLEQPWRTLLMVRPGSGDGTRRVRLRVGNPCGEHTDERYAIASDSGPVVCVLSSDLAALEIDAERLREGRLFTLANDQISRVVVEAGGRTMELSRDESAWNVEIGGESTPADDGAISEWINSLRESRALAFEPYAEGARGIASPTATLTIHRASADEPITVTLGERAEDGVWVRRGDENALVRFDARVAELLDAQRDRFRSRELVGASAADARVVTVRRGDVEERAVRGTGGDWALEAPIATEADRIVVREIAQQIATLRAERFVADEPADEHGLASPRISVTVRFEPSEDAEEPAEPRTVTLNVGALSESGAYARLDGEGPVFEISRGVNDALGQSLVSLDLLTIDTESAESIRIERGGEVVVELRREGSRWIGGAEEATAALIDRLGTLRATGVVAYGAPEASLGLDPPATRVTIDDVHLDFGQTMGEGDEAFIAARKSGLDVVYLIRPDLLRAILEYPGR